MARACSWSSTGWSELSHYGVTEAQVAQVTTLALPVADLAGDSHSLFVQIDCFVDLPEFDVTEAEATQCDSFAFSVFILLSDG